MFLNSLLAEAVVAVCVKGEAFVDCGVCVLVWLVLVCFAFFACVE